MTSTAVQEAVALLRQRYGEAEAERRKLTEEMADISAALRALGAEDAAPDSDSSVLADADAPPSKSVRASVLELLEAGPTVLTIKEIMNRVRDVQGERDEAHFRSVIRTSLWTLRNEGLVVSPERGRHAAARWFPKNASDPADTGSDVGNGPADGVGGENSHEASPASHDHLSVERNGDRGLGAPVAGVAG